MGETTKRSEAAKNFLEFRSEIMFTYSIIIPHRNTPELLRRCLKSIPIRQDTQVIVVDDSSDSFLEDYRNVQESFPTVNFYATAKQSGGGAARNLGLENATGKYILFSDADDFFSPELSSILDDYQNSDFDLVFFNAISVDSQTLEPAVRASHVNKMILESAKNYKRALFHLRYEFGEPWCKMVRKGLIDQHKILFEETNIHNDTQYSYLVGFFAKSAKIDSRILYTITFRSQSVSRQQSDDRILTRAKVFSTKRRFLKEHGISFFDPLLLRALADCRKQHRSDLWKECFSIANFQGIHPAELYARWLAYRTCGHFKNLKKRLVKIFHFQ